MGVPPKALVVALRKSEAGSSASALASPCLHVEPFECPCFLFYRKKNTPVFRHVTNV